jgi:hypothetical protein
MVAVVDGPAVPRRPVAERPREAPGRNVLADPLVEHLHALRRLTQVDRRVARMRAVGIEAVRVEHRDRRALRNLHVPLHPRAAQPKAGQRRAGGELHQLRAVAVSREGAHLLPFLQVAREVELVVLGPALRRQLHRTGPVRIGRDHLPQRLDAALHGLSPSRHRRRRMRRRWREDGRTATGAPVPPGIGRVPTARPRSGSSPRRPA